MVKGNVNNSPLDIFSHCPCATSISFHVRSPFRNGWSVKWGLGWRWCWVVYGQPNRQAETIRSQTLLTLDFVGVGLHCNCILSSFYLQALENPCFAISIGSCWQLVSHFLARVPVTVTRPSDKALPCLSVLMNALIPNCWVDIESSSLLLWGLPVCWV